MTNMQLAPTINVDFITAFGEDICVHISPEP